MSIKIHDTTLRDGEQAPGVVLDFNEKIKLAEKIMQFGASLIDIMPIVSDSEFRVTKELTDMFGDRVSATCRTKKSDIDVAIDANAKRVTLIIPMSDLHITKKLGISREENIQRALEMIDYARSHGMIVDFAGEDASRADFGYFKQFLKETHNEIAVFFIADTVGCLTPDSTRNLVYYLKKNFSCRIGLHMHNDFGLATANTIEGALSGADYFSGTFTGIGERAGNAPIEEVCVALKCLHGKDVKVRYEMLKEVCDLVQEFSGVTAQKHKPIIGENAFTHESGIHVDGILKHTGTYESFDPESVGHVRKIRIGKHSGRGAIQHVFGEHLSEEDSSMILKEIKNATESKKAPTKSKNGFSAPYQTENNKTEV